MLQNKTNSYYTNYSNIETTKEPGVYNIKKLDYLNDFVITITNTNPQQVKYSVLVVYEDGTTKTDSKILTFNGRQSHSVNEFENLFKDDPEHLKPKDVYYFVYPYGSTPYKWHFVVKR